MEPDEVTWLLLDLKQGKKAAEGQLIPLVYEELRQIAGIHLRHESPQHSLQPTALVNAAYIRLTGIYRASVPDALERRPQSTSIGACLLTHFFERHCNVQNETFLIPGPIY